MAITLNQHKEAITKRIIASFSDASAPKMGLSGFFKSFTTSDRQVGIEVERNRQLVAVDIQRGGDANMNTFNGYSEKLYEPPMFLEGFDFSSLDRYNVTFGKRNNPSMSDAFNMIDESTKKLKILRSKIERAIELQRSQALQTGVVEMKNGDNVNYNRKADSIKVLGPSDVWTSGTSKPLDDLEAGCKFLREEGLTSGTVINAVFGRDAFREFLNHDTISGDSANEIKKVDRLSIGFPDLQNVTGLTLHGKVAVYDFTVHIWTYSDFYELSGVKKSYIDENKVVMIAEDFEGKTAYAGIPAIMRDKSNAEYPEYIQQVEAEFYINNYVDPTKKSHMFDIGSAPLAIPVSIDRVYTFQPLV